MLISANATKMPTKTRSRALTLGNLGFLFLQHVLAHAQIWKIATYQSLSLPNQMSTHVSLLYHAYIKLSVTLRKRLELLRNCAYGLRCASQFRSRFVFLFLSHFHREKEIQWHFNEANHSKEPMDSVGATIKNKVFREVKSGRLTITFPNNVNLTSPEELSNAAEGFFLKIISI